MPIQSLFGNFRAFWNFQKKFFSFLLSCVIYFCSCFSFLFMLFYFILLIHYFLYFISVYFSLFSIFHYHYFFSFSLGQKCDSLSRFILVALRHIAALGLEFPSRYMVTWWSPSAYLGNQSGQNSIHFSIKKRFSKILMQITASSTLC